MDKSDMKDELKQLCILAITLLEHAKASGLITEDEFNKNIKLKKDFLEYSENSTKLCDSEA